MCQNGGANSHIHRGANMSIILRTFRFSARGKIFWTFGMNGWKRDHRFLGSTTSNMPDNRLTEIVSRFLNFSWARSSSTPTSCCWIRCSLKGIMKRTLLRWVASTCDRSRRELRLISSVDVKSPSSVSSLRLVRCEISILQSMTWMY